VARDARFQRGVVIAGDSAAIARYGFVWEWEWQLPLLVALVVAEIGYLALLLWGARRGRESDRSRSALAFFTAGIVVVALAVMSPIGANDERFLSMHMLEHDLLMWVAAPLLVRGALPLITDEHWLPTFARRWFRLVTRPPVALTIATLLVWTWHAPAAYGFALTNDAAHAFEHFCYIAANFIYWWPLMAKPSEIGGLRSNAARAGYLVAGSLLFGLLAALLAFADHVWYPHYLHVAGATAASALADQRLAGALMLYPGAIVFVVAAVLTISASDSGRYRAAAIGAE
jgi:putative membrane protein